MHFNKAHFVSELFVDTHSAAVRFDKIDQMAKRLGFDFCTFGSRVPDAFAQPPLHTVSSCQSAWQRHYQAQNYVQCDPLVRLGLSTHTARALSNTWPTQDGSKLYRSAEQLRRESYDEGLRYGWLGGTQSNFGARSFLVLHRREPLLADELAYKQADLQWVARIAHEALGEQTTHTLLQSGEKPQPTESEMAVLGWMAHGKSAVEISDALLRSVDTVNFHVRHVLRKLDAKNKTIAVVKALRLGLL